jgi:hypothetical protein
MLHTINAIKIAINLVEAVICNRLTAYVAFRILGKLSLFLRLVFTMAVIDIG